MNVSLDAYLEPTQHEQDEQDENGCTTGHECELGCIP